MRNQSLEYVRSVILSIPHTGAAMGPVLFGLILDMAGGEGLHTAWITAFTAMAALVVIQPLIVLRVVRPPLMYD